MYAENNGFLWILCKLPARSNFCRHQSVIIVRPKCQPPSKTRTDGRTDGQTPEIEFGASVTSGGNNLKEFPDN